MAAQAASDPLGAVTVRAESVETRTDASGKEFVAYNISILVREQRVHLVSGRYSSLLEAHAPLPSRLGLRGVAKFPSKNTLGRTRSDARRGGRRASAPGLGR